MKTKNKNRRWFLIMLGILPFVISPFSFLISKPKADKKIKNKIDNKNDLLLTDDGFLVMGLCELNSDKNIQNKSAKQIRKEYPGLFDTEYQKSLREQIARNCAEDHAYEKQKGNCAICNNFFSQEKMIGFFGDWKYEDNKPNIDICQMLCVGCNKKNLKKTIAST